MSSLLLFVKGGTLYKVGQWRKDRSLKNLSNILIIWNNASLLNSGIM